MVECEKEFMHSFLYSMLECGRFVTNPIKNLNSRGQTSKENMVKSEGKRYIPIKIMLKFYEEKKFI